jgi:hypothetical protein
MKAKEAVEIAKNTVADLFAKEGVTNLGLEELEYDDVHDIWRITIGFSRSWDSHQGISALAGVLRRTYKIVAIDKDGKALSVKNREIAGVD